MVIVVALLMAMVILWNPLIYRVGKWLGYDMDYHPPAATQPTALVDAQPTTAPTTGPTVATGGSSTQPVSAPTIAAAGLSAVPATQPASVEIGSEQPKDATFPLELRLVPQGAAVSGVVLNDYKMKVGKPDPYVYQEPYAGFEAQSRVLATRSVTINGTTIDTGSQPWSLVESSSRSATYALELTSPTGQVARIVKKFELFARDAKDQGGGYEVLVTQTIENKSDKPINFATTFNATNAPPQELDRGSDRSIVGGYDANSSVYVGHHYIEEFGAKQPTRDYTKAEKYDYPLVWCGTASVYFDAIVRPEPFDPNAGAAPNYIGKVEAVSLNPDAKESNKHVVVQTIQTKPIDVAPGQSLTLSSRVFFGPKLRSLLKTDYYTAFPRSFDTTLVMTGGMCAVCTFQWLINILVGMLNGFHWVWGGFASHGDWGMAIITLVIVVRICLHPITKRAQVNMSKMSKFGPEIERLKKKYGDDKDELNKAMMQFYKEHGATPVLGCLPMFLQTPIWIALWSALQSTFELRHAPFLWGFTWIKDLSLPDHLVAFAQPIPLFGFWTISGINVLPILMGGVFYLQQKFQPKPPSMTPEQEQQQKMMQWMTLLFPLMLYNGPSGLNLYILTSTTIGIIESKRIRDHIKEQEEAEKAGKVIIDAPQTRAGRGGGKKDDFNKTVDTKPKGLMGWMAALQEKAEQARREDRRGRGKA